MDCQADTMPHPMAKLLPIALGGNNISGQSIRLPPGNSGPDAFDSSQLRFQDYAIDFPLPGLAVPRTTVRVISEQ